MLINSNPIVINFFRGLQCNWNVTENQIYVYGVYLFICLFSNKLYSRPSFCIIFTAFIFNFFFTFAIV